MTSRHYCWTINGEFNEESKLELNPAKCRYSIWQLERCPTTGRLHFQGYSEFKNPVRIAYVKKFLGHNAHCEKRHGPRPKAIAYCRKEDTRVAGPWELGSPDLTPGKRSDLCELALEINDGKTISAVRSTHPVEYIKYRRGIEALVFANCKAKSQVFREVNVLVYYGRAGTGKTRKAVEEAEDYYILDQGDRLWFDGYEGESTLIIDDFYGWIKYGTLLRILDGYQFRCEIKGGFTYALWSTVVITSNKQPCEWYSQGMTPALERRISNVDHFE